MKYYSEMLNQIFDNEKDLLNAEKKAKDLEAAKVRAEELKKEQRTKRAKEVQDALKAATEANKTATDLLKKFTKDYGYFHTSYSITDSDDDDLDFFDVLHRFLL